MTKPKMRIAPFLLAATLALPGSVAAAAAAKPVGTAGKIAVDKTEAAAYLKDAGGAALPLERKRELLTQLLVRKSLARDGEARGLGKDPVVEQGLLKWKLKNYPDFYWEREAAKVTISDEQLRAHIDARERVLLSAIVFGLDAAGRAEAEEVVALLAAGGDFAQLARERSLGLRADVGGDFGWNELPNKYVEEKEAAVVGATAVGSWTPPLETQIGWVIFQVRGRKTADDVFAEEKEGVRAAVLPTLVAERRTAHLAKLRAKAKIAYPAEKAIPGAGAPLAVIDGYAVSAGILDPAAAQHEYIFKDISTPKERLEAFIDAFIVVREVEKTGLDKDPVLKARLGLERTALLSQLFLRAEAEAASAVSEAEMRAEYQRYYVPEVYSLQIIAGNDRARLEEALAAVRGGEPFDAAVARFNDTSFTRARGVVTAGPIVDMIPEVRRAIEALPDGGVSGVLANGDSGWLVVKRVAMQRIAPPPFEEVANTLRAKLQVRKRAEFLRDYAERYRKGLKISIDDEQLRAL